MNRTAAFIVLAMLSLSAGTMMAAIFDNEKPQRSIIVASSQHEFAAIEQALVATTTPPRPEETTTTLIFTGDIMLSRAVDSEMRTHNDYAFPFRYIASSTRSADLTFGNLEGIISDKGSDGGNAYSFRANTNAMEGLLFAGYDGVFLANNHIMDWGRSALSDGILRLHDAGIMTVGAGQAREEANTPMIFNKNGTCFGLLSFTTLYPRSYRADNERPGISDFDEEYMTRETRILKQKCDVVFVALHWGEEYMVHSNGSQQKLGHTLIDAGADVIVGTHPHVAEELEKYGNGYIAYSLGNFVFDQPFSEETMRGKMLSVTVRNKIVSDAQLVPYLINTDFQPYIKE